MGFLLKNFLYSVPVVVGFYAILITGDGLGLRQVSGNSFSTLSIIITFISFNFAIANIRIK